MTITYPANLKIHPIWKPRSFVVHFIQSRSMKYYHPIPYRKPLYYCALLAMAITGSLNTVAQSPIVAFATSYVSAPSKVSNYTVLPANPGSFLSCLTSSFKYTFSNGTANKLRLVSFTASAQTFLVATSTPSVVKIRRVNNTNATGNRSIVFMESAAASAAACPLSPNLNFKTPYIDSMEVALNSNAINWGTDNLFANTGNGSGNNNNIERVDVIFPAGLSSSAATAAGFAILERGNNNAHDPFRIAAILSLDASGNPASFGPVKTCAAGSGTNNGSWGHPATANGNVQLAVHVMRKDGGEPYLRVSSDINQEFGGVFFTFADLGIPANQTIYGYALIGSDGKANPGSAQLLNLNDQTVYPTSTPESSGGLDLIAVTSVFAKGSVLAAQPNALNPITRNNTGFRFVTTVMSPNQPVKVKGGVNGQYKAVLYNYSGLAYKGKLVVTGSETGIVQLPGMLAAGPYWLTINNKNDQSLLWSGRVFVP
jgi:hypothetical protein